MPLTIGRDPLRDQLAAGDVVLQEQRLGAAGHQVVDDHGHQVDADGVVHVHRLGDRGLGADTVRRRGQHRVAVAVQRQPEQRGEPADPAEHLGPAGLLGLGLDQVDGGLTGRDGDPGAGVGGAGTDRMRQVGHGRLSASSAP